MTSWARFTLPHLAKSRYLSFVSAKQAMYLEPTVIRRLTGDIANLRPNSGSLCTHCRYGSVTVDLGRVQELD